LTTTLAAANPSAIPVLCGSCSNLSVLNLVDTMPMYVENHHAAGAVVPFYDPHVNVFCVKNIKFFALYNLKSNEKPLFFLKKNDK
jgi:hypothetical protein